MFKNLIRLFKFIWFHFLYVNNRLVFLWRVISTQIVIRIIKALIILPSVNGVQLITISGMIGVTDDWYSRMYEYNFFKHQLKLLQGIYKSLSNTLFPNKLDKIKRRISGKNTFTLGTGQNI